MRQRTVTRTRELDDARADARRWVERLGGQVLALTGTDPASRQALADPSDLGHMRRHRLDVRQYHLALPGRLAHTVDGLEQAQAQRALDPRQAPPHRGLVDAQPRAGAGIGALVPHGRDDAQVVPIHRVGLITRLA